MKKIKLTKGKEALVDDEDFEYLNQFKWCVNSNNYVSRAGRIKEGKRGTLVTMHREIMKAPKGMQVDHINGNRLDNRKKNLRLCTISQNCTNRASWKESSSGYRGVYKRGNRYVAYIKLNKKQLYLGSFSTSIEAAKVFDNFSKRINGEFAVLNFSKDSPFRTP